MKAIKAPKNCPSCNSLLKWSNNLLYCKNKDCGSQTSKKIEYFAKALKIKGLGPATIEKLGITRLTRIYEIYENEIAEALNSRKMAEKLFVEISNSMNASLNLVLPALSIPLVGKSATKKLATVCKSIKDINKQTCKQATLGEKTTNNLLDWIEDNILLIEELPFSFKFEKPKSEGNTGVICISGRLKSYKTKAEATTVLEELGYTVKSSLTKDVTILINESGVESAKTLKARDSGINIVTNLKDFIGEKTQ